MAEELVYTKEELPTVTKMSASTIEEEIRNGNFPPPRELSKRRVGWLAWEIRDWLAKRPVSGFAPPPNTGAKKPRRAGTAGPAAPASQQAA